MVFTLTKCDLDCTNIDTLPVYGNGNFGNAESAIKWNDFIYKLHQHNHVSFVLGVSTVILFKLCIRKHVLTHISVSMY